MYLFLFTWAELDDIFVSEGTNSLHWRLLVWAGLQLVTKQMSEIL